jgi:hypothetical protein
MIVSTRSLPLELLPEDFLLTSLPCSIQTLQFLKVRSILSNNLLAIWLTLILSSSSLHSVRHKLSPVLQDVVAFIEERLGATRCTPQWETDQHLSGLFALWQFAQRQSPSQAQ